MLITYLFIATFISLSFWFYFKNEDEKRGIAGKAFLISGGLYTIAALVMPGTSSFINVGVHLLGLFAVGFFINSFSKSKLLFFSLLGLMVGGYYSGQIGYNPFNTDKETVATNNTPPNIDKEAELLLELSNNHAINELNTIAEEYNLEFERAFAPKNGSITDLDDYYVVNIPTDEMHAYDQIVNSLRNSGLVDNVEANEVLSLDPLELKTASTPPHEGEYTVNDPDLSKVWGFRAMEIQQLYDYLAVNNIQPKKKAKIAIIDTGVDKDHEDLMDNFVSTKPIHDQDPQGHGTHCAGIAAAVSNNGKGVASFAPNGDYIEITSIKVFGKYGSTSQKKIIDGMIEAADNGAVVLSMSLGGPSSDKIQRAYKQAVQYANKKGAIVVVAAGNENMNAVRRAPASVDGVITVSAIDENIEKASFSNTVGDLKMGIAAPGAQVYSTIPNNEYEYFNGTSMATPYVAGLVGLLKSLQPKLTTKEVYKILNQTGKTTKATAKTGKLIYPAQAVKELLKQK